MIFYKGTNDLIEKLLKYKKDTKQGKSIAKKGWEKYHKYLNSELVAKYIVDKTFDINKKSDFLWD